MTILWAEHAWLPGGVASDVRIETADGLLTAVTPNVPREGTVLRGLVLPGFANAHSHVFHRALRGRTHHDRGTFWTWRDRMYELAAKLDPDSCLRLARAVYAEMTLAGYTAVGEFHYLHHAPGGRHYDDPNAMGHALIQAAAEAGIRLTLLDTCYLAGGFDRELSGVQLRFGDGDVDGWAARLAALKPGTAVVGAAVHSVRAVPAAQLPFFAGYDGPLHVHLSEQRSENDDCRARHGCTPTELLHRAGVLGPRTVAVHATHLTDTDISSLSRVCFCPTTERDLGDGIGPARRLADAGAALCLGSDSQAVIDPFAELRALELHERLAAEERGCFAVGELMAAASDHSAIGQPPAALTGGAPADLVVIALDSVRTAGTAPGGAVFAASAADVTDVLVGGRWIVRDGVHQLVERPAAALADEVEALWRS
ncbi:formimidoylglutamate deiminase [Amycolatopsis endophytica]|uniref:Formiminoglutamate deiminase n=1 Tax=Amycolatopsis endophytica TaxID=860233 RepID=A0A853AXH1_9PSEU|nr:formimidoylglutamate deiminase [Amycolatopsis endophytica]NYI87314.1 formiminoglutamate deiminase [Amycolatopsis endophytica]